MIQLEVLLCAAMKATEPDETVVRPVATGRTFESTTRIVSALSVRAAQLHWAVKSEPPG